MATMVTDGLDEFMLSMQEIAGLPNSVVDDMLQAGGEVLVQAQKRAAPKKTGTLKGSIKKGKMFRNWKGAYIDIKPEGTHHTTGKPSEGGKSGNTGKRRGSTGNTVSNAEVAFIHEFGAPGRNIKAQQWILKANEQSATETTAAKQKVYDDYLTQKGL